MSFFDSFFGNSQRRDIKNAYRDSQGMLRDGYDQGRQDIGDYYGKGMGMLQPFMEGGQKANALYLDYLGANGPDAQRAAFASFQNDPGFQQQMQAGIGALDNSATARGGLYSGAAMKGIANFGQQFQRQAFNDRMGMLGGAAQQGQQAGMAGAGLASQTGGQLGNMAFGFGQQNAANRINYGNAMAGSRNIGLNNLMGVAGLGLKAFGFGGFGMPGAK
jgi:hypothetical protein